MSMWTYVTGTIDVNIPFNCHSKDRALAYVNWAVEEIKRRGTDITGSEGPCVVVSNMMRGHTSSSSESGDSMSRVILTLNGCLRDRELERTVEEAYKFVWRLSHFFTLEKVRVLVRADMSKNDKIISEDFEKDTSWFDHLDKESIERKDALKADQQWRIRTFNKYRFFDHYLDPEKCLEIAEIFSEASVKTLECLMNNFGLSRLICFDIEPEHEDYLDERGLLQKATEEDMDNFLFKKLRPKKYSKEELLAIFKKKNYSFEKDFLPKEQRDLNRSILRTLKTYLGEE